MAVKTFTEVVESKLASVFAGIYHNPEYTGFITNGFPVSIAIYLKKKMIETKKPEVSIAFNNLCEFKLKATKKGDAVAFIPEFAMLPDGQKMIDSDDVNISSKELSDISNNFVLESDYKDFIVDGKSGMEGCLFVDDAWVKPEEPKVNGKYSGVELREPSDTMIAAFSVILSIIEILANNKDAANDISYTIDGFGTFTVKPVKNSYTVSLTFDKEFKGNCKSDKLTEIMSNIEG